MLLGLGVESRGKKWEGQEGSSYTSQQSPLSSEDLSLARGPLATIAGDPDLPAPHHTRRFQVAVVLSFLWEASLLPAVPCSSPFCEGWCCSLLHAQPADVTGSSGKHQQPGHMLAQPVMQTG